MKPKYGVGLAHERFINRILPTLGEYDKVQKKTKHTGYPRVKKIP